MLVILFDFDGTLADTRPAIVECIKESFEFFDLQAPPKEKILDCVSSGHSLDDVFSIITSGKNEAIRREWITYYRELYDKSSSNLTGLYNGVTDVLSWLQGRSVENCIVSNKGQSAIDDFLEAKHLKCFFKYIFGDTGQVFRKPDLQVFTSAIEPLLKEDDSLLVIGDTATDISFAKNIKCPVCWARYGYGDIEQCSLLTPDFTIDHPIQIQDVVKLFID